MARFKEKRFTKSKLLPSSKKQRLLFEYAGNHRWKFYVGLIFLLFTVQLYNFSETDGNTSDCVKNKDNTRNMIAGGFDCRSYFYNQFFSLGCLYLSIYRKYMQI
jgi:hypothetical protein